MNSSEIQAPFPSARVRAAALVLIAGAFAVVLAWAPSRLFDLERYLVPKALALHATALALLALGVVPLRRAEWGRIGSLLLLLVGWSALSGLLAENRWLAFEGWGITFSGTVVFLAARALPLELRRRALAGILGAAVLAAALAVAQAYGAEGAWLSDSRPPGGTFGNRNFLGHLSAIATPVALMTALRARRRTAVAAALIGLAVLTAAVVLTRSRAAWLGGIAGVSCALVGAAMAHGRADVLGPRLPIRRIWAGAAAMLAAVAIAVFVPNELDWVTDAPYAATLGRLADYREGSGAGRLVQYENSLALVPDAPVLGVGPGNWFVQYPRVTSRSDPAYAGQDMIPTNPWPSSDWVALLVERGSLGAALLLLAGAAAAVVGLRGNGRDPIDRCAAGVALGVLAAAFVCGAFDAVLLLAAPLYLTMAAVGLALPPVVVASLGAESDPDLGRRRTVGLWVAVALVAYTAAHTTAIALTAESTETAALQRAARWAPGEHRLQLALAERGRCENARRAAALMPYHPRVQRLASCG